MFVRTLRARRTRWLGAAAIALLLTLWPMVALAADTTYTVQPGDNLYTIARRFNTDPTALAATNHIANPNILYVGQTLHVPGAAVAAPTPAPVVTGGDAAYIVQDGDTLSAIAARYGVSVYDLAAANNISVINYIYAGQTLRIPGKKAPVAAPPTVAPTAAPTSTPVPSATGTYTVQPGDTLTAIAQKSGTTVDQIIVLNHITDPNILYVGQILRVSGNTPVSALPTAVPTHAPTAAPVYAPIAPGAGMGAASGGKWIDVNLSQQRLTAYEGNTAVFTTLVSTGLTAPTPVGSFAIQSKLLYDEMRGPGYDLPNVPYTMYFLAGGYAIHGTYWHHNFGHPMSHGCVNLPTPAAGFMFNWSPIGTPVRIHW